MQRVEIIVDRSRPKIRLEDFLFEQFPGLSRMYLRRVVKEEKCEVNGRLENIGYRLRGGDFLEVEVDLTMQNSMRPENVPLEIVFEDQHLIVVNKPAGMLVHPTNRDKNGTLLNALVFYLNRSIADCGSRIADSESAAALSATLPVPVSPRPAVPASFRETRHRLIWLYRRRALTGGAVAGRVAVCGTPAPPSTALMLVPLLGMWDVPAT